MKLIIRVIKALVEELTGKGDIKLPTARLGDCQHPLGCKRDAVWVLDGDIYCDPCADELYKSC